MTETDPERREPPPQDDDAGETPEEFAEDLESDPAHNPDDPELERLKGG